MFCCWKDKDVKPVRQDIIRKYFNNHFVPFVFRKPTKILTTVITILLIVLGGFSTKKILRGLNQNVSLVSGSDIYEYFETLYIYGDAGPPAYVIFHGVNYTDPDNIAELELINAELAALNNTVQSPIYSWVSPFKNFISKGEWSDSCGSDKVMQLSFDE